MPRRGAPLSVILALLAEDTHRERISVADLLLAMHDRALAALMFVLALPNVLPMPPGTSSVFAVPLALLALQMTLGLRPWLPRAVAERSLARRDFARMIHRAVPWLVRAERLLRPRLGVLALPPADRVIGAVCLLLAIVLFLPIPLGNMLPALAICLLSLGILERDGLWVVAGLVTTLAAIALVSGVLYALVKGALLLPFGGVG